MQNGMKLCYCTTYSCNSQISHLFAIFSICLLAADWFYAFYIYLKRELEEIQIETFVYRTAVGKTGSGPQQ